MKYYVELRGGSSTADRHLAKIAIQGKLYPIDDGMINAENDSLPDVDDWEDESGYVVDL